MDMLAGIDQLSHGPSTYRGLADDQIVRESYTADLIRRSDRDLQDNDIPSAVHTCRDASVNSKSPVHACRCSVGSAADKPQVKISEARPLIGRYVDKMAQDSKELLRIELSEAQKKEMVEAILSKMETQGTYDFVDP
jgi:hypothetical protein